jgi:hypothetical protein
MRFLKVPDNAKLSTILDKLLPNILAIYFEPDFNNLPAHGALENAKLKALEEVVSHLMMKVSNSKGEVTVPLTKLIRIFHGDAYVGFENSNIKAHARNKIFDFIFAQYGHLSLEIGPDMNAIFLPILNALSLLDDNSQEKAVLMVMFMYRLRSYLKAKELKVAVSALKKALLHTFEEPEGDQEMQIDSSGQNEQEGGKSKKQVVVDPMA